MTASALAVLYLLFVIHYSVNFLFWDEWGFVPLIHATLHSHLTLGALWAQHNENRMLVPNLVIVGSALVHNYDSKSIILLSAAFFVVSYGLLLATFRTYVGRSLTALHALSLGVVWFSLEDTENSLWGFQLAWYMIVFFLMSLLFLLLKDWRYRNVVFSLAVVSAVAASFSSLQGLILWPIGLICLVWERPPSRRRNVECSIWLVACALTTATYLHGYRIQTTGGGSPNFALHHPWEMTQFFLVAIGNVVPTTATDVGTHELIGLALLIVGTFVVVRSVLDRRSRAHTALPVALIVFGVCFDGSIALGRLGFGVADALSDRYTMANLILLTGIIVFALANLQSWRVPRRGAERMGVARRLGIVLLAAFLVFQGIQATRFGTNDARGSYQNRMVGARTVVNLNRIPVSRAQRLVSTAVYPTLTQLRPFLTEAKDDHLSVFAPGAYQLYRSMGAPAR